MNNRTIGRDQSKEDHLRNLRRGAGVCRGDQKSGQLHAILLHRFRSLPGPLTTGSLYRAVELVKYMHRQVEARNLADQGTV
jgi:hypothetical protein